MTRVAAEIGDQIAPAARPAADLASTDDRRVFGGDAPVASSDDAVSPFGLLDAGRDDGPCP